MHFFFQIRKCTQDKGEKIVCELTKDIIKVYTYHGYVSVINAILSA